MLYIYYNTPSALWQVLERVFEIFKRLYTFLVYFVQKRFSAVKCGVKRRVKGDFIIEGLSDHGVIKRVLGRHGFSFSKALGQNFLVNPTVCPRIAEAGCKEDWGVLEVGPGIGVLTHQLALRAKKVKSVELDNRLPAVLAETLAEHKNVEILEGDILKLSDSELSGGFEGMKWSVCANLPYYITSPVIMRFLESGLDIESITVMVQKEAAQRLCAKPGSREAGAITLAVCYHGEIEMLFPVSRGSFMPAPKVDSAVIQIRPRKEKLLPPKEEAMFFRILKAAFGQRRKTLLNSLGSISSSKETLSGILTDLNLKTTVRPEELSLDDFLKLSAVLANLAE